MFKRFVEAGQVIFFLWLWPPLIEFNFGPQEDYGNFTLNDAMTMDDKSKLSGIIANLASSGLLDMREDVNVFREAFELKKLEDKELDEWLLQAAAEEQALAEEQARLSIERQQSKKQREPQQNQ